MTKLLEQAFERVQALPLEMQDQAARIWLAYAGDEEPILALTPEEEADLMEARSRDGTRRIRDGGRGASDF